jgi:hypothetical protein
MHLVKALYFVAGLALTSSAHAACPGAVTSITQQSGGASLHVTVVDQLCNPIAPAGITWSGQGALSIIADTTGFNFTPPPGTGAVTITATAKNTTSGVTAPLQDAVTMPTVTGLSFTSP